MKYILILFFFFSIFNAFATISYLAVNHTTKELFWAESGHSEEGFIGWEVVPERSHDDDLEKYLGLGYTYTKFPYKLDVLTGLLILLPFLIVFIRKKKPCR